MIKLFFVLILMNCFNTFAADCGQSEKIISTYTPKYAKHFKITFYQNYKLVEVDDEKYFLISKSRDNCPNQVHIPLHKIGMTSTTYLPALELLELNDRLQAFQGKKYIFSEKYLKNNIAELPFELNLEQLISLKLDAVMAYQENLAKTTKRDLFFKMKIPLILNKDLLEQNAMGRAEWIVFIASFFDKEKEAVTIFKQIEKSYKNNIASLKKKKVRVLVGEIQNGKWATPGGMSDLAMIIKDAGGELVFESKSNKTQFIPLEKILNQKLKVDVWLPQNMWINKKNIESDSRYNFIEAKKIYNFNNKVNQSGANDYWEMGLQRPDLILKDLSSIFSMNQTANKLIWYREL